MYFINDNFIDFKKNGIKEGGVARNNAWIGFVKKFRPEIKVENFKIQHRLFKYLHFFSFLAKAHFIRNDKVFFLYPKVGLPVLASGKRGDLFRKLFFYLTKVLIDRNNTLIFDISDIKYEQAIDLELEGLDLEKIRDFEKKLFTLKQTQYIFASFSMRDYAVKQHGIPFENTDVCVNGGFVPEEDCPYPLPKCDTPDTVTYVYAGTLNKGRMIENMIDAFPNEKKSRLILLGTSGEWIEEHLKESGKTNVLFLGAFEENVARSIVAQCDVGMIPYDDSRLYYNIAYPTKLSFYIVAGLPYFSTPVAEINRVQEKFDLGYVAPMGEWNRAIAALDKETVMKKKAFVKENRDRFTWNFIYGNNQFV